MQWTLWVKYSLRKKTRNLLLLGHHLTHGIRVSYILFSCPRPKSDNRNRESRLLLWAGWIIRFVGRGRVAVYTEALEGKEWLGPLLWSGHLQRIYLPSGGSCWPKGSPVLSYHDFVAPGSRDSWQWKRTSWLSSVDDNERGFWELAIYGSRNDLQAQLNTSFKTFYQLLETNSIAMVTAYHTDSNGFVRINLLNHK